MWRHRYTTWKTWVLDVSHVNRPCQESFGQHLRDPCILPITRKRAGYSPFNYQVSLIHGLPGCAKTRTDAFILCRILLNTRHDDHTVLVYVLSNTAVAEVAKKLRRCNPQPGSGRTQYQSAYCILHHSVRVDRSHHVCHEAARSVPRSDIKKQAVKRVHSHIEGADHSVEVIGEILLYCTDEQSLSKYAKYSY